MTGGVEQGGDVPGYTAPVHRALTEPILLGGAPRSLAIVNGTLAGAIGLGLRLANPVCFQSVSPRLLLHLRFLLRLHLAGQRRLHLCGHEFTQLPGFLHLER